MLYKKKIVRCIMLSSLLFFTYYIPVTAYIIEKTTKASTTELNWNFELWNKTDKTIYVTVYFDPSGNDKVISFKLKKGQKARSKLPESVYVYYVFVWSNINQDEIPDIKTADLKRKIEAEVKTMFLSYEKEKEKARRGFYKLRPQKGAKGLTQSGLALYNNVTEDDIISEF